MTGAELYEVIKNIQAGEMITQEQLCAKANVGRANLVNAINNEERRKKPVSIGVMQKLIAAFPKYFEPAIKKAGQQKIEIPAIQGHEIVQLQATLQAFLQHYCDFLESQGFQTTADTMADIMNRAMKNLTKLRVQQ